MTIDKIDWGKLKAYAADKRRSFEELCYQIVERTTRGEGRLIRIDGAGGDGGVEMYLTRRSGDEWGWQAKFFWPDPRLQNGNRKEQIKRSLASACANHPRLTRWTLMTPGNFTQDEIDWFEDDLTKSVHKGGPVVPTGRTVELAHKGESKLLVDLGAPSAAGLRAFFFGELELTLEWFARTTTAATAKLHGKYLEDVHSSTRAEEALAHSLAESTLPDALGGIIDQLKYEMASVQMARPDLDNLIGTSEAAKSALSVARSAVDVGLKALPTVLDDAKAIVARLSEGVWRTSSAPGAAGWSLVSNPSESLRKLPRDEYKVAASRETMPLIQEARQIIREMVSAWSQMGELFDMFARAHERLRMGAWHIFGSAGSGKTHVAAHVVNDRIDREFPAILLLGEQFTTDDPISTQVRRLLHVDHVSWDTFVGALAACADAYQTRIPIIIDGLNETTRQGALSPIWRSHLATFCTDLNGATDAVVVITTCRDTYEDPIWDGLPVPGKMVLHGYLSYDVNEAVKRYFQYYKIVAERNTSALTQFRHPIYLRLFCEAVNPGRSEPKPVVLGEEGLFPVFDKYLEQCNKRVAQRLGLATRARPLDAPLAAIAEELWRTSSRFCDIDRAYQLAEGRSRNESKEAESIVAALEHEDLLVFRDWGGPSEVLRFTYDLMAGYWIARALVANEPLLTDPSTKDRLFGEQAHPLARDIVRGLAALVPRVLGRPLHALFDHEVAFDASISALFEIGPNAITDDDIGVVGQLFERAPSRVILLRLSAHVRSIPGHKLNMEFWDRALARLAMTERDLSWSECVREQAEDQRRRLQFLERSSREWTAETSESEVARERLRLLAIEAMWTLTTTVRPLRDQATRALYWYGRREPDELLAILERALRINDPYVGERVLAAVYGVVMARAGEGEHGEFRQTMLPRIVRVVFASLFVADAPHATTHALARDYARHAIERALVSRPDLLMPEEVKRVRPQFLYGGIRSWQEATEQDAGYRDGSAPIHMDFGNYTLGRLVPGRDNYDNEHPEYKKVLGQVLWRIYELGYDHATFAEVDRRIASAEYHGRGQDPGKTDRYGKKYSWIAYFELWGARADAGLLMRENHQAEPRPSDVDIDPSFPEEYLDETYPEPVFGRAAMNGSPPAHLETTVFPDEIAGEHGPWILVEAFSTWRDGEVDDAPASFIWVRSLVMDETAAGDVLQSCREGSFDVRGHRPPTDNYTFAGEVPWADTFAENDAETFYFDRSMDETKAKTFEATFFTRRSVWEDYHTTLVSGRLWSLPSKQVCTVLGLQGQPEQWDLFDAQGRRATRNAHYGNPLQTGGHFTFMRRDLVEAYLAKAGKVLLVAATGERLAGPTGEKEHFGSGWMLQPAKR